MDTVVDPSHRRQRVRTQVGAQPVIAGVSGGVDSAVAAALVRRAVGDQLTNIFVNTGMLRQGEPEAVVEAFGERAGGRLFAVDASESFLDALAGVTDPEAKRRIIGEKFIRSFEEQARRLGSVNYLVQGTIYPDVVESSGPDRPWRRSIRPTTTSAARRTSLRAGGALRYLFRMRCGPSARRSGCRSPSSGASRSPARGLPCVVWEKSAWSA
jgi:GMP synthase (glutamine-hydrolysing)